VRYQPYNLPAVLRNSLDGAAQLRHVNHGMEGFDPAFYRVSGDGQAEENTHHYAGHLLAGFYLGNRLNQEGTRIREVAQGLTVSRTFPPQVSLNVDEADIRLGEIAGWHGSLLSHGWSPRDLVPVIRLDLAPR